MYLYLKNIAFVAAGTVPQNTIENLSGFAPAFAGEYYVRADMLYKDDISRKHFNELFPVNKEVMLIGTHPDDVFIFAGRLATLLSKYHPRTSLVTVSSDETGVTDSYAEYYRSRESFNSSIGLKEAKRIIRYEEAELNAKEMGFKAMHKNFDLNWPIAPDGERYIFGTNRLASYSCIFEEPTEDDYHKIRDFVFYKKADIYVMAAPFSFHPHHRAATNLFLKAIRKFTPDAFLYFWSTPQEKNQPGVTWHDDILLYYSAEQETANGVGIKHSNRSQNDRIGDDDFYSGMSKEIAEKIAKDNRLENYQYAEGFAPRRLVP